MATGAIIPHAAPAATLDIDGDCIFDDDDLDGLFGFDVDMAEPLKAQKRKQARDWLADKKVRANSTLGGINKKKM